MSVRWYHVVVVMSVWFGLSDAQGLAGDEPGLHAAVLKGRVTYEGAAPEGIPISEAGTVRKIVDVDRATKGLRDVVISIEGVAKPSERARIADAEPVVMDQREFAFVPHVLAVEAGRAVEFLNSDVANHGVTASSLEPRNRFNVVTPPGGTYVHRFAAARSPVALGCPVHASMAGWVAVFDHPYFAVTDEAGGFEIRGIPPGRYTLVVRHPSGGMLRRVPVEVEPGNVAPVSILFRANDLDPRLKVGAQGGGD